MKWVKLEADACAQDEAADQSGLTAMGLNKHGFVCVPVAKKSLTADDTFPAEVQKGLKIAQRFILDVRGSAEVSTSILSALECFQKYNPKTMVSIICNVDQQSVVYKGLDTQGYTNIIDAPYIMDCDLEAWTMADRRAADNWEVHAMLQELADSHAPLSIPFALIVTGRVKGASPNRLDRDPTTLHSNRHTQNPCPPYSTRDKSRFSMNLSRYWQDDTKAPMCNEYPYAFAYANFFWWHMHSLDLVVTLDCDPQLNLAANYMDMRVMALSRETKEEQAGMMKALQSQTFMNHHEQLGYNTRRAHMHLSIKHTNKYIFWILETENVLIGGCVCVRFWSGYPNSTRYLTIMECSLATRVHEDADALGLLHAQTADPILRFSRSNSFWTGAFIGLEILPKRIRVSGKMMLGCVAGVDLPGERTVAVADGFWWPKGAPLPTTACLGTGPFDKTKHHAWGVNPKIPGAENLLYFINASCPLALINDYRDLADSPNAALVQALSCHASLTCIQMQPMSYV